MKNCSKKKIKKYTFLIFLLQKSLLENCQNRVDMRQEVKNLRSTFEKTQEKLMHKEQELAAAHAENQMLKLQVITNALYRFTAIYMQTD